MYSLLLFFSSSLLPFFLSCLVVPVLTVCLPACLPAFYFSSVSLSFLLSSPALSTSLSLILTQSVDATFKSCDIDAATCVENRPCSCSCGANEVDGKVLCSSLVEPTTEDVSPECEDLWGSCHLTSDFSGCEQTKVTSVFNPADGNCYKVGDALRRECHTQICAADAFRVPFKVQVVLELRNVIVTEGSAETNTEPADDLDDLLSIHRQYFEDAVALSASDISPVLGIDPGDVSFEAINDWLDVEGGTVKGSKIIVDISIKNAHYVSDVVVQKDTCEEIASKAKPVSVSVKDCVSDAAFAARLAQELEKFKAVHPGFVDIFRNLGGGIEVAASFSTKQIYCKTSAGGGGEGGGGGDGGGSVPTGGGGDGGDGAGAGVTVVVSFALTFLIVGFVVWYNRGKGKDGEGKYRAVGEEGGGGEEGFRGGEEDGDLEKDEVEMGPMSEAI